jgi:2'-5' RNA ligase
MNRYFFAFKPDKLTLSNITHCQQQLKPFGKQIHAQNLHMTLLFIGPLSVNQQAKIIQAAEQIRCIPFSLHINKTGYFKGSQVSWIGPSTVPDTLLQLHQQLCEITRKSGIDIKPQHFAPHITLARKSYCLKKQLAAPFRWTVSKYHLLQSVDTGDGIRYHPVKSFACEY